MRLKGLTNGNGANLIMSKDIRNGDTGNSPLADSNMPSPSFTSSSLSFGGSARKRAAGSLRKCIILVFFVIGLIVCVTSLTCILMLPSFVTNQIAKRLVLKNNSLLLDRWSKPNVPMYFKVWIFDVKNAQEIVDKRGTKPKLKEIGPFVFHLKRKKDIVSFAGDNLYYTERRLFHFSPELSCCAINTTVTIPNIPLVAVVDRALSYNLPLVGRFIPRLINRAIQSLREQLFIRKQVREILFDGYDVELLKMVSRVGSLVGMPQTQQRFAILKGRNDTWRPEQDGVWAINTGAKDRRKFGKVSSWNSYRQLPFWAAPSCNQINGSDGTLFPPPIRKEEPLYIFNQELCRTVNLVYERPSDIRTIKAYRYVLNPLNFAHTMPSSSSPLVSSSSSANSRSPLSLTLRPAGAPMSPRANEQLSPPVQPRDSNLIRVPVSGGSNIGPHLAPVRSHFHDHNQNHNHRWQQQQGHLQPAASEPNIAQYRTSGVALAANAQLAPAANPTVAADEASNLETNSNADNDIVKLRKQLYSANEATTRGQQEELVLATQAQGERESSIVNPQTCFCDRKSTNLNGVNVCEFDGLIELSKCTKQAQVVFGSMPHFYQSDPRLLRQVAGLEPNASKHTTYLDIEPNTGLVLGGKRRVQLNLIIKRNNEVEGFENINDMLIPVVWFEESALIPEESARKFKSLYTDRIRLVNIVLISLFLAALGLLLIDLRIMALQYSHYFHKLKITSKSAADAAGVSRALRHSSSIGTTTTTTTNTTNNNSYSGSSNSNSGDKQQNSKKATAKKLAVANKERATRLAHSIGRHPANFEHQYDADTTGNRQVSKLAVLSRLNLPLLSSRNAAVPANISNNGRQEKSLLSSGGLDKFFEFTVRYNDNSQFANEGNRDGHGRATQPGTAQRGNFASSKSVVPIGNNNRKQSIESVNIYT